MIAWPAYRTPAERARNEAAMAALVSGAADLGSDPLPDDERDHAEWLAEKAAEDEHNDLADGREYEP